jgi:hypothetical protein
MPTAVDMASGRFFPHHGQRLENAGVRPASVFGAPERAAKRSESNAVNWQNSERLGGEQRNWLGVWDELRNWIVTAA